MDFSVCIRFLNIFLHVLTRQTENFEALFPHPPHTPGADAGRADAGRGSEGGADAGRPARPALLTPAKDTMQECLSALSFPQHPTAVLTSKSEVFMSGIYAQCHRIERITTI